MAQHRKRYEKLGLVSLFNPEDNALRRRRYGIRQVVIKGLYTEKNRLQHMLRSCSRTDGRADRSSKCWWFHGILASWSGRWTLGVFSRLASYDRSTNGRRSSGGGDATHLRKARSEYLQETEFSHVLGELEGTSLQQLTRTERALSVDLFVVNNVHKSFEVVITATPKHKRRFTQKGRGDQ